MADAISCFADRNGADEWRVEYFDSDGGCYVTIFTGPLAQERALDYERALVTETIKTAGETAS
jgi:hypothetical protein